MSLRVPEPLPRLLSSDEIDWYRLAFNWGQTGTCHVKDEASSPCRDQTPFPYLDRMSVERLSERVEDNGLEAIREGGGHLASTGYAPSGEPLAAQGHAKGHKLPGPDSPSRRPGNWCEFLPMSPTSGEPALIVVQNDATGRLELHSHISRGTSWAPIPRARLQTRKPA